MASLSLKHINKTYPNGFEAVKDFNLEIEDKEFIIFVGPSGCGKSTTLRMIAGLEDITSGDLYIDGTYSNDLTPKERDISMVFQSYALFPNMTVYQNMAFGLKINHVNKEELDRRVRNAAEILQLTDYLDRKPANLSGGQMQRVAIARAIAKNPKILLCDEPTGALDYNTGKQILKLLQDTCRKENMTVIIITHNSAIAPMADKIIHFKNGKSEDIVINKNPTPIEEIEW